MPSLVRTSSAVLGVCGALLVFASSARADQIGPPFLATQIGQYLMIGTGNNQTGDAINVQKTQLGADTIFVSNPDPNLADVFDAPGKQRWNSTTNRTYDNLGLPSSAPVFEGTDDTGHMAITSPTGGLTLSNTSVHASGFAVRCASPAGTASGQCRDNLSSPSSSPWIQGGVNQGDIGSGFGVVGSYDHSGLNAELVNAWTFINSLTAEFTIAANLENGFSAFDVDGKDTNNDGYAVIDINVGSNDWKLDNYDWILNGDGSTFGIFRVRGSTNMLMSNSSIALGPGGIGNGSSSLAPNRLGAIFVQYQEPTGNTDQVFNFNNVILNGVGFWDLNAFRNGGYDDGVNTELTVQNGQGCSQFISSSVTHTSSVRWNHCAPADPQAVSEPATLTLVGLGFGAFVRRRWRGAA